MNDQQILELIRINERQSQVAKQRGESDVAAYHQSAIKALRDKIGACNTSSAPGSNLHGSMKQK
jgi:hypothetical protein